MSNKCSRGTYLSIGTFFGGISVVAYLFSSPLETLLLVFLSGLLLVAVLITLQRGIK